MGTHLLNVTGRKKIIHAKSGNTEVKIIGENSDDSKILSEFANQIL